MKEKIVSFTTYGPNRGKTLVIGNYQFQDGICDIKESDAVKAATILNQYHDVCYEHELETLAAEYDMTHGDDITQTPASFPSTEEGNTDNDESSSTPLIPDSQQLDTTTTEEGEPKTDTSDTVTDSNQGESIDPGTSESNIKVSASSKKQGKVQ